MAKKYQVDLLNGNIFRSLIIYALPLVGTNVLQLLFNSVDVFVLGFMVGDEAVAAVGSVGALINLVIGLFTGLAVGANVAVALCVGRGDREKSERIVGMSVIISVVAGIIIAAIGVAFGRTFLEWMSCDAAVIDLAAKYLRIYFIGMPIMMLYNFVAAILRAVGDTLRPFLFLIVAGIINLGLNVFFIAAAGMDVDGVAIATVVSQGVSAALGIIALVKQKGYGHLSAKKIRIYKAELTEILKVGIPAGLQGCIFSITNVMIQSYINGFGKDAMAGGAIASQFEGIIFQAMDGVSLSCLAFTGQNNGAGKFDRIKKVVRAGALVIVGIGVVFGAMLFGVAELLYPKLTKSAEVAAIARNRLVILLSTYFLCGLMGELSNVIRGLGKSVTAMAVTFFGSCVIRIVWLQIAVPIWYKIETVYLSYPISWIITVLMHLVIYEVLIKKIIKQSETEPTNPLTE